MIISAQEYRAINQKSFNRMAQKYNMPKYEKNYSRILSASGLALSGFVGMTILNNWYSRKEEYVNYLL